MTSHAAVVARGMGRPCVAGAGEVKVNYASASFEVGDVVVKEGQLVTIDGVTGEVMLGEVPTVPPQLSGSFGTIMAWADEFRTMQVRANAETPTDARQAEGGSEGDKLPPSHTIPHPSFGFTPHPCFWSRESIGL